MKGEILIWLFKQYCVLFVMFIDVIVMDKEEIVFKDLDVVVLVGFMLRREGMERKDLLKVNVKIFKFQGIVLEKYVKKLVKVIYSRFYGVVFLFVFQIFVFDV